jgi:hypothetical protein
MLRRGGGFPARARRGAQPLPARRGRSPDDAPAGATIAFDDVTASAGVAHTGYSFGRRGTSMATAARPGGSPNHFYTASLYRNRMTAAENATARC